MAAILALAWAPLVAAEMRTAGTCESLPGGVIEVEGTGGSGSQPTGYATLGAAFTAINGGVHTGAIAIDVCGDTNEGAATATLNASGSGAASYTTITMSPAGGAARTMSGATTAGNPLIDLNGADNVTINGLNTGGNALTISNTTVSATSGTSTIRFQADATNNLITNASVLGSANMAVGTNGGNIWFGSAAVTTGNDNNTVSNCNIGPAGANLPTKGIYFSGSSNTDPGTANSGITINNNNIFDYFSATVSSAGIDLGSGTVGTTISNNRFFQTAPRTMTTTGLTHSGIRLSNSSGNAYQITGNTIGFATSTGTGSYGLVFPTTTTGAFIPINVAVNTITVTNITGNTIAGIAVSGGASGTSTTAPFRAIYVSQGLATANNNVIGSQSATGSITYTSSSTSASDVIGIFNFGTSNWTTNGNTVGGITAANSSTGAANIYGLRTNTGSTVTWTCTNNTIGGTVANSIQTTSTATGTLVQGILNSNPIGTFTGNIVRNLTAAGGTGTTTTASVVGMVMNATSANQTLTQNTIFNLSNSNTTAATIVTGIQFTGSTANVVERNLIYGLSTATNSATAELNGIRVGGGTTIYRNNMIAIGAGTANAIGTAATNSSTTGVNGINEFLGTDSFFHNSVYIGGSPTAGTGPSFAFNGTQTTNTRSFRDNIFFNARSNAGATGKHYAVKINGTAPNPTGLTINNNLYFANGSGAVFGFFNSLDVANLAAWKTAVGQDAVSFESNPQFNDPTNATPDLHLHPTNATVAEGNGVDVGVTQDFDGQTRSGLTPVDIGADAGNFVGLDLAPPAMSYAVFGNTGQTSNRTLAVTITDVTGVATGGLAPRIYYRKNAGAYFSQVCSLTSGSVTNGNWSCVVNNADVGGVVATDVIGYFVVAQDTLGNVGSNPAGAVAANVNTVTTPPTPNTYTIVAAFSGSIPVGTGQTYTSLTNPGGIFEAINAGALSGNVSIDITSDLTVETGTHALNQWPEDGVGGYSLTIRPSGAARTISGTNAGALIRLNGADRVTIDGSTTGGTATGIGGNAALRELTIQNTNVGTSAVVIAVQSGAAGAQNDTIRNVNVLGQDPTTTLAGIVLGGATPGTAGTDNDGNRIENCTVKRSIYGIYSAGQNAANPNTGTTFTMNDLSATGIDRVRRIGIAVFNESGVQITLNSIGGLDTNESADGVAIGVGTQGIDNTLTTAGGVTGALVSRNRINGVNSQSTVGFSAAGIAVAGSPGAANVIANNMITGVISPATSPDIVAGVYVAGVAGTSTRVLYNSIAMSGDRGTVATQMPSFGVAITGTDPTVELKDNAFVTTQIASGGGVNAKSYAIGMVTTTFANLDANYNDYFSGGANAGFFRSGSLNAGAGTDYAAVAAWATAVADDANSLQIDPPFVSAVDLHLQPASTLIGAGTPVAGVTVDFDGEARSASTPSIGADEIAVDADLAITKTDGVINATPGGSVTYTITASNAGPAGTTGTVNDTFAAPLTCTWTCVGAGGGTCTAAGSGNIADPVTLPSGGSVTYTASCTISAAATGSLANTATVAGVANDPNPANNSATDTDTLVASANVAITKTDGVTIATPGGSTTYTITASNAGPSNTTATVADTFPAALTCTWTCVGAGGGTCTAAGAGNINDSSVLPTGGSVTYTASCAISAAATGTLVNTATATGAATDPTPGDNSATDTDTLVASANVGITKTDGVASAIPGGNTTYTIVAGNVGPSNTTATVADTFPATLTCTWTCVGAGGGTCTAAGAGNINDSANLPVGGSATYTASCAISASATGSLANTATVTGVATDPAPGNNSASDTDTLTPQADLAITKSNGTGSVQAGGNTTYTIVASNNGPSNNASGTVADMLAPDLTCTWTCAGAGGGSCTAAGAGNINDSVNLPAGGSATYTLACGISVAASGTLSNTATITSAVTDPNGANNSATDADPVTACGTTVVSNLNDSGAGSLRQAILNANACPVPDTITFTTTGTIALASSLPNITDDLVINGPGADQLIVQGNGTFRLMNVGVASVDLSVNGLTLAGGAVPVGGNAAALEFNSSGGQLSLSACTLRDHLGGILIYSNGSAGIAVLRSTFAASPTAIGVVADQTPLSVGNSSFDGLVTALYVENTTATVDSSTVADSGIGMRVIGGVMRLRNNVFVGNSAALVTAAGGTLVSFGNNVVSDATLPAPLPSDQINTSALLAPLGAYGGPTPTRALLPGSAGIDAGTADELQSLTIGGSAGSAFFLIFNGSSTVPLTNPVNASQVQTALQAMPSVGVGNVAVTTNGSAFIVRFQGALGGVNLPQITAALAGATATIATLFDGGTPTDQRGIARPQLGAVDSGAYESRGFTLAVAGGNNQSTGIGLPFASPLVVNVTPNASGEPVNGGVVTYTPPGAGASASVSPNPATIASAAASTTATANGTVGGPYTVSAAAIGANTVNFSLTNISLATTTTITSDAPDASVVGQPYTVAVRVSSLTLSPEGTVTVSDGTGATCGPVALMVGAAPNSTASCNLTSTTAGAKTLTASYAPANGLFQASNGTTGHLVNPAATTISVSGPARSRINQPIAFSFVLGVSSPGTGTPTGTVTLQSGATSCTATLPVTSCNLTFTSLGARTVSASYAGDGNYAASISSGAGNAQTLVFALADIFVSKSDGRATYLPGDLIVYSVLVRNLGPDAAANIRARDNVPTGLASVSWSCDASGGAVCPAAGGSGNLDVMLTTLPNGGLIGFTFFGTVGGSPTQIVNIAAVELPADTTIDDPVAGNNSATDTDLLDYLLRNGFEDPAATAPSGAFVLPSAALRSALDEVALAVYTLDDANGIAAQVYARVFAGELQYALASRDTSGVLHLSAWRSYASDPTLRWTARAVGDGWRVETVDLR